MSQEGAALTAVHVTHEAVCKIGGIGAVLEGLITSPAYAKAVGRTILVGPLFDGVCPRDARLRGGKVLYSSLDDVDQGSWHGKFKEVCERYGAGLVYGTRVLREEPTGRTAEVETLLVDVRNMDRRPINDFKWKLHQKFDIHSDKYEVIWDYEQYLRLALPAFDALKVLLGMGNGGEAVVISHEFMGIPTALRALMAEDPGIGTIFHAHEVATARRIVEEHPGHDTMFYNLLEAARNEGLYMEDLFGSQDDFFKHALVKASRFCDGVFAVGHLVRDELHFLSKEHAACEVELVPNGIPAADAAGEELERSRSLMKEYAGRLIGWRPDYVFTHVARLVTSKAFWRDIEVLDQMERMLLEAGKSAVFFLLSTEGAERTTQDVLKMEKAYGWPWNHEVGYPDLTGSEIGLNKFLQDFNRRSRAVKVVFVNQFGWEPSKCGQRMPKDMNENRLRQGTDVEFGQSIYEPFGISQLEPLTYGAICVPSSVCGCVYFARAQLGKGIDDRIVVADYVSAYDGRKDALSLLKLAQKDFDRVGDAASRNVAGRIMEGLRSGRTGKSGYEPASRLSWDVVVSDYFLPGIQRALGRARSRTRVGV